MPDLTELQRLADLASPMPWDTSPSDVPYEDRKAFTDAFDPDTAKKLIAVALAALAILPVLDEHVFATGPEEEALRKALEELKP